MLERVNLARMSQTLRLFLDLVMSTPILIVSASRYAIINPKNYDGDRHSKLFALVGGFDEDLRVPIDGGVLLGDKQVFVLDSSLNSYYLLLKESHKPLTCPLMLVLVILTLKTFQVILIVCKS